MDAERYRARTRSVPRRLTAVVWLSIIAATGCKDSSWTPMGSAEVVLSEIKIGGATTVSKRIDSDESFGRSVTAGVATGLQFAPPAADQLAFALGRASALYQDAATMRRLRLNGMHADVSWRGPAKRYAGLYREIAEPSAERATDVA